MKIPMYVPKPAILFNEFMDLLEEKYEFDHRNFGVKPGEREKFRNDYRDKWLEDNGFSEKAYVLDKPLYSKDDWPKDSEEMKLRIQINSNMNDYEAAQEKFPYRDFWHYVIDQGDGDISNGSFFYLSLEPEEDENKLWVNTILGYIREEVKDNPAYDAEECVRFYVGW